MAEHRNYIAGDWVDGQTAIVDRNPSDLTDVIGEYAQADAAQVNTAVDAACAAFPKWVTYPPQDRSDILDAIGTTLMAQASDIGETLSREEGKIRRDGVGEVMRAARIFKFFAAEVLRHGGQKLPSVRLGVEVEISRGPIGVIGIITPWNFPIAIPAWKIAPALAYGNALVFKPAELVPASAWELARVITSAGVPPGVFNLVVGRGSVVGEALVSHPKVDAISFTGSVETGRRVATGAVSRMAKVQVEMGGKNPLVVLDDADLEIAVECAYQGAYEQTGQRCTASSRLIVTEGIHDRFVAELSARITAARVGNAIDSATDIGPVVSQAQLEQDLMYLAVGRQEGAQLVAGGERLSRDTDGFYLSPALFVDATNEMRIAREEIFGPVATVIRVGDYEEALAVANDSAFGLVSGIVTASLKHAADFRAKSQAGMVMINLPTAGVDYHVPFGGTKASSYGAREQGSYAAEFFTTVKTVYVRP